MNNSTVEPNSLKEQILLVDKYFAEGNFYQAGLQLDKALEIDFDSPEVQIGLKCCHFWNPRKDRFAAFDDPFESGEFLLREWKNFDSFIRLKTCRLKPCIMAVQRWVFGAALSAFKQISRTNDGLDREVLFRMGRCYKGIGDYENALSLMEMANHRKREDAEILAELADVYALINEIKSAKIFFREAFFIDPQKVDLVFLESRVIRRLIERVEELAVDPAYVAEWIPVYGVLTDVFNVKRELKSLEFAKLRQSIYTLENEVKSGQKEREERIIPRLINRYFWLIDHYMFIQESRHKIEEVLEKLKILNSSVHEQFLQTKEAVSKCQF
ncbi:MAG: tetratricopeptide repeat protein [Spirochaetales bacterium]|jgi:tetratricopeptide (TPR) repeat protein|nr:tetratricopeptide repeat protein [Spirochaetales bacterium]